MIDTQYKLLTNKTDIRADMSYINHKINYYLIFSLLPTEFDINNQRITNDSLVVNHIIIELILTN